MYAGNVITDGLRLTNEGDADEERQPGLTAKYTKYAEGVVGYGKPR